MARIVATDLSPDGDALEFSRLALDPFELKKKCPQHSAIALRSTDAAVLMSALMVLDGWASEVHLLGPGVEVSHMEESVALASHFERVESHSEGSADLAAVAMPASEPTKWVVYTSGTTGEPKPVVHTRATLARMVVRSETAGRLRWGLLYDPNRMAGLQVLLQAAETSAELIAPSHLLPLGDRLRTLAEHGVSALSATPTLWRSILSVRDIQLELDQITLGGEVADQLVLDALKRRFPAARIVHVFASTETGAAFSVRDGLEGFPSSYLREPPKGIALDIRDGILHVHSPGVSTAARDGFASTGDIVEIEGDRVKFVGRASGVINVGGANVWPEQVETTIRGHPEVLEAVVTATPNAMSGNLLVATIVPTPDADLERLNKRVRLWMKERVPNTHVPAMVKVVDSIDISLTGKAVR